MKRHRPPIDTEHLAFIPIAKVPERVTQTHWEELFKKIPPNQALVLDEGQANPDSIRAAVQRFHTGKQFTTLEVRVRGPRGKRTTYILNHGKAQE